ncbi:APC family permease [Streptomyces sp. NPDC059534]|uniref:APC family permease n=1 Tax=Streptomyces sp. NPDC059534 TaxID=3346859 RepID=UPI0036A78E5B
MSTTDMASATAEGRAAETRLQRGSIGTAGIVFIVIAGAAPLTAMAGNIPLSMALGNGVGVPGAYVLVGALLLVFSVGFAALSRHVVHAGAFYAYIGFGLGRGAGAVAAFVATIAYNASVTSLAAAFAFFTRTAIQEEWGVRIPWELLALLAILAAGLLNLRGVAVSTRILATLMALELGILLMIDIAVVADRGARFSFEVFEPAAVFGPGVAIALLFGILSFAGFEATAVFSEEVRNPRRTVGRATFAVVVLMALVFAVSSWAALSAYDDGGAVAAARANPGDFAFELGRTYLGAWSVPVMRGLVVLSFLASVIAVHNMAARYIHSLGRSGLVSSWLAVTHPRLRTPHRAGLVQVVVSCAVLGLFALLGADPLVDVVPALAGLFTVAFLALMAATSFAIHRAFATRIHDERGVWTTKVAPLLAGFLLTATCGLVILHYGVLVGSDSLFARAMPAAVLIAAVVWGVLAHRRRVRRETDGVAAPAPADRHTILEER